MGVARVRGRQRGTCRYNPSTQTLHVALPRQPNPPAILQRFDFNYQILNVFCASSFSFAHFFKAVIASNQVTKTKSSTGQLNVYG